jgi:cystathionine beta-lyase/cystathionine gamma-synthase
MKGDGGSVLSFDVKGSVETMEKFVDSLKLFALTPSLGCVESLVAPCLCLFGDDLTAEDAKLAGISPSTVRLAVGIEDSDDLISDLKQALESLQIKS